MNIVKELLSIDHPNIINMDSFYMSQNHLYYIKNNTNAKDQLKSKNLFETIIQ